MKRYVLPLLLLNLFAINAFAAETVKPDSAATIRQSIEADLTTPFAVPLVDRQCLDGRPTQNFPGEVIEYWIDFDCAWCKLEPVAKAQANNPDWCIVVRHATDPNSNPSLQKSLIYEALRSQSFAASLIFWQQIHPKDLSTIPADVDQVRAANEKILTEGKLDQAKFAVDLQDAAAARLNTDMTASLGKITSTPTYVVQGVRLSACDFNEAELKIVLPLVKKAKAGEKPATEELIKMVVKENEE